MENHYGYDNFGLPSHTKDGVYPLRANDEGGYNVLLTYGGDVALYQRKVIQTPKGAFEGGDIYRNILETAVKERLEDWNGRNLVPQQHSELRVNIINTQTVRDT